MAPLPAPNHGPPPLPPPPSPPLPQVYPYLVINGTQVAHCRSEERVLQLLSMVNLCLEKDKVLKYMYMYIDQFHKFLAVKITTTLHFSFTRCMSLVVEESWSSLPHSAGTTTCISAPIVPSPQETSHRYLLFSVPRVVAVAPQMRLVEDNTSNVSLSDIFKQVSLVASLINNTHSAP